MTLERRTVRTHLSHIYRKMGVNSHVEAVVIALQGRVRRAVRARAAAGRWLRAAQRGARRAGARRASSRVGRCARATAPRWRCTATARRRRRRRRRCCWCPTWASAARSFDFEGEGLARYLAPAWPHGLRRRAARAGRAGRAGRMVAWREWRDWICRRSWRRHRRARARRPRGARLGGTLALAAAAASSGAACGAWSRSRRRPTAEVPSALVAAVLERAAATSRAGADAEGARRSSCSSRWAADFCPGRLEAPAQRRVPRPGRGRLGETAAGGCETGDLALADGTHGAAAGSPSYDRPTLLLLALARRLRQPRARRAAARARRRRTSRCAPSAGSSSVGEDYSHLSLLQGRRAPRSVRARAAVPRRAETRREGCAAADRAAAPCCAAPRSGAAARGGRAPPRHAPPTAGESRAGALPPRGPATGRPVLLCHGISANDRNMDLDDAAQPGALVRRARPRGVDDVAARHRRLRPGRRDPAARRAELHLRRLLAARPARRHRTCVQQATGARRRSTTSATAWAAWSSTRTSPRAGRASRGGRRWAARRGSTSAARVER